MSSLAITNAPKNWDEVLFQPKAVSLAKHWLKTNEFPNLVFISGTPGIGKTSLGLLLCKAIHCLNREPGEVQPCGHCEVCLRDPRNAGVGSNIIWVQAGTGESMAKQVEVALDEANKPPYGFNEEHRDWKIIAFDELQSLQQHIQKLLYFPDLARTSDNRVIFIALTMSEESLKPVDLDAFKSRGSYLKLRTPSENQIFLALRDRYPTHPLESLNLIASASQGNMRAAYNLIEKCLIQTPTLDTSYVSVELEFCDSTLRKKIWSILEKCGPESAASLGAFKEFNNLWSDISEYVNCNHLLNQLIDDLVKSFENAPTKEKHSALTLMISQTNSRSKIRLDQFLKLFVGQRLIDYSIFDDSSPSAEEVMFSNDES